MVFYSYGHLLVITGYFNGIILIIHSINGVLLVLITGITRAITKELQLIWVQLQLIWVWFFECALGHVDQIYIYMYIYVDICDVDLHVQI